MRATTIITALVRPLQTPGKNVLAVDICSGNLLRSSFNVNFTHRQGWTKVMLDGQDWRDAGLRHTLQLNLLSLDQLSIEE